MSRYILVVDDEPEKSLPLVRYLQSQGYTVRFASGGREALSLMEAQRPDLVICDLEMPDIGGYGVMEATATRLGLGDLPFILAHEEWTIENWSQQAGGRSADCHWSKPFPVLEIGAYVGRIFRSLDEETTELAGWEDVLSQGLHPIFSPSGQALIIQPVLRQPLLQSLEIHFADGRQPLIHDEDGMITPLAWVSATELVYRKTELPLRPEAKTSLHVFCVEDRQSHPVMTIEQAMRMVWMGRYGHLCVLADSEGTERLFDLDVRAGTLARCSVYDNALDGLEVYPLFGHAWSDKRQEVALIAWPRDYLEEGVEPTKMNSQWSPLLDTPWIQDDVSLRRDGSRVTQRELTQEAKRKKPPRLFLLDKAGACLEVPGTYKAHHPLWSPDGSLLAFIRYEEAGVGMWLLRRSDLSLRRIGGCLSSGDSLMHPYGVLFCKMVDETIPNPRERERIRSAKWYRLKLMNGSVHFL